MVDQPKESQQTASTQSTSKHFSAKSLFQKLLKQLLSEISSVIMVHYLMMSSQETPDFIMQQKNELPTVLANSTTQ
jgi:hypothetical protein